MSALAARGGRSAALGAGLAAIWLASPVIAGYAVYMDDWRPLLALFPLLGLDHLLFRAWLGRRPADPDRAGVLTAKDEGAIDAFDGAADFWDHVLFFLEHPGLVQRLRYGYRGALMIRSAATVLTVAGFIAFVAVLPDRPAAGAVAALLVVAAGGSLPHQATLLLTPRMRVKASQRERDLWLRWDRRVENAGWITLAVLVAVLLLGGR